MLVSALRIKYARRRALAAGAFRSWRRISNMDGGRSPDVATESLTHATRLVAAREFHRSFERSGAPALRLSLSDASHGFTGRAAYRSTQRHELRVRHRRIL